MFLKALQDNIEKYESRFGEIKAPNQPSQQFGFTNPNDDEKVN
jgi:hypothetical protein